jgi:hypothetical protein
MHPPWVARKQIVSRPATSRSMSPLRRLTTTPTGAAPRDLSCHGKIGHREELSLLIGVLRRWPRLRGDLGVARLVVYGRAIRAGGGSRRWVLRMGSVLRRKPCLSGYLRVARLLVHDRVTRVRAVANLGWTCRRRPRGASKSLRDRLSAQDRWSRLKAAVKRVVSKCLPLRVKPVLRESRAVPAVTPPRVARGRENPRQRARRGMDLRVARSLTDRRSARVGAMLLTRCGRSTRRGGDRYRSGRDANRNVLWCSRIRTSTFPQRASGCRRRRSSK